MNLKKNWLAGMVMAMVVLSVSASAQVRTPKRSSQKVPINVLAARQRWEEGRARLVSLKEKFVQATKDYLSSLEKLRASYEKDTLRASADLANSRELYAQSLIQLSSVQAGEKTLEETKKKVGEVDRRIENAKQQLAETEKEFNIYKLAQRPSDKELLRRQREDDRADRESRCSYWTVTTAKKSTSYKICQH